MKYAVVAFGGKQYKVSEGDVLEVDFISTSKVQDGYTFSDVLLFVDGATRTIGTPLVSGVTVSGIVVEQKKGEKIRVAKFKAKARYRKVIGHRSKLTAIKIDRIATV